MKYGWIWVFGIGASLTMSAPAQTIFSFEDPALHGYADDADPAEYCDAVGYDNCWQIFQSMTGVTDGSYSMGVKWPGGFRWLISDGDGSILPLVRQSGGRFLVDITAVRTTPWSNFIVSYNDGELGWRQTSFQTTVPRNPSTMTVLVDASSLALPSQGYSGWFQINLGMNAGGAHEIYMDNLRVYDDSRTRPAITFDTDLQGFSADCATLTWSNGAMQVSWSGGFCWLFGGTADGLSALLNRGHLLVMDITVPSAGPSWSNMIIALNHDGGWSQTSNPIDLPTTPGTYTIAVDYRDLTLPDPSGWVTLNLGVNAGGAHNLIIDNIRVLVDSVPGDVNGDGCVDDSDLLAVLFAFGQTGSGLPEDLNGDGTVDDADLLIVLFNFGTGC